MTALDHLDATSIAARVRAGDFTAIEVAEHFLRRIELDERTVHAIVSSDPENVRAQAEQDSNVTHRGPLFGVPLGVKDIFDTVDYPTEFYSSLYAGNRPSRDAHVVARMRHAGCVLIGKTHTAEFAYMHTGPTCNPHDRRRTPGSSSAGSAAGIAAGFFPLALGTQTAGSILKPAAYCGVYAFKPSFGTVSLEGVKPLAPSFDTVGWFGRSAADLELVSRVLIPGLPSDEQRRYPPRIGRLRVPHWIEVDTEVETAMHRAITKICDSGCQVQAFDLPFGFETVCADHQSINDAEAARSLQREAELAATQLSPEVQAMLDRAALISWDQETAAKRRLNGLMAAVDALFGRFDAIIGPSCGIVAPTGLTATGPSDLIKLWTAFGLPQANVPLPREAGALPIGLQVVASFRNDAALLHTTKAIAATLYPIPE